MDRPGVFPALPPATYYTLFGDLAQVPEPPLQAWTDELDILIGQHLAGLALRRARDSRYELPQPVLRALTEAQFAAADRTQQVVHRTARTIALLEAAGIGTLALKGPAISAVQGGPTHRPFSDIDILVPPADFRRALELLLANGLYERDDSSPPWPFFRTFCREATNLRGEDGTSLDLHHHIAPWIWGQRVTYRRLAEHSRRHTFLGETFVVPDAAEQLLIVALHVISDHGKPGRTLRVWRDLLVLVERTPVDDIVTSARAAQLEGWLAWLLATLPPELRPAEALAALRDVAADLVEPIPHLGRLRRMLPVSSADVGDTLELRHCLRLPAGNAVAFTAGLVVPSRPFVQARYPASPHPYVDWWYSRLRRALPLRSAQARRSMHGKIRP